MGIDNPVHLAFIAIVALVVLGPKRLPELARALGHGIREFRQAVSMEASPEAPSAPEVLPPAPVPAAHAPLAAEAPAPAVYEAPTPATPGSGPTAPTELPSSASQTSAED
jgi:TatA/E family protein of Tat protein translocase